MKTSPNIIDYNKSFDKYFPNLGFGLGLRIPHYQYIFANWPEIDWFEIISENFMDTDGKPKRNLARIRERYPVVMHGIGLSIGTIDPLNSEYLQKLANLIKWLNPAWISDHLCWTGIAHKNSHDLLPVPYTEEALRHIVARIKQVQDYLERPIALENPSTYLEFKASHIPEAQFIAEMANESGCGLLLDVNNVYVSCYNHRLDPKKYIDSLPLDKVVQIHLSGHSNHGTHIIDTHDDHVISEVLSLYRYVVHKAGRVPNSMIEWDDNIPEWSVLYAELDKVKQAAQDSRNYAPLPDLERNEGSYVANITTKLSDTEQLMQDAIFLGEKIDSKPEEWIRTKEQFPPDKQLEVYINSYRYRLYDVTAEDYPVLQYALGDDDFERLITDFVNNVRSEHFNITRYSAHLPEFIARHELGNDFLIELTQLESAVAELTDPEETTPLTEEHLIGINEEELMQMQLYPRKALRMFAFQYPVNIYYCEFMEDKNPEFPERKPSFVVVFRHDDVVWRMNLEEKEYLLLKKLFAGEKIGEAIENLQKELSLPEDELGASLAQWFARWIRNGIICCII